MAIKHDPATCGACATPSGALNPGIINRQDATAKANIKLVRYIVEQEVEAYRKLEDAREAWRYWRNQVEHVVDLPVRRCLEPACGEGTAHERPMVTPEQVHGWGGSWDTSGPW